MKIYKVITEELIEEEIVEVVSYILDEKDNVSEEIKAMTAEELALIGWSVVEDVPRPEDTAAVTYDLKVGIVEGVPRITWVERPKTNEELLKDAVAIQIDVLNSLLGVSGVADLATLRGVKATANADINASPAKYIKALTDILIELVRSERRTSRMIGRRFESTE